MADFSDLFSNFVFANFCFYLIFFPVNNVLNLSPLTVRYLFLSVITFCIWRIWLKTAGISIMPSEYNGSL